MLDWNIFSPQHINIYFELLWFFCHTKRCYRPQTKLAKAMLCFHTCTVMSFCSAGVCIQRGDLHGLHPGSEQTPPIVYYGMQVRILLKNDILEKFSPHEDATEKIERDFQVNLHPQSHLKKRVNVSLMYQLNNYLVSVWAVKGRKENWCTDEKKLVVDFTFGICVSLNLDDVSFTEH